MTEPPNLRQTTAWLALAAGVAFAVPAVFTMALRWERSLFLVPYVGIIGGAFGHATRHGAGLGRPGLGLTDGLLLNVFPVLAVQGAGFFERQPSRSVRLVRGLFALAASLAAGCATSCSSTHELRS